MKGIILAGGNGTRLYPVTIGISKQLMPIYDKPMIYYPLSVLMMAGIKDILIITNSSDKKLFQKLLGNGKKWGIKLSYKIQENPNGIAEAFIIGEDFIKKDNVCLILGDNIFYGKSIEKLIKNTINLVEKENKSVIFGYKTKNAKDFGVIEFGKNKKIVSIEEKPINPKSNYAVTGIYFYTNDVIDIAKKLSPSKRGELEITDINQIYLKENKLKVELLSKGYTWFDTGNSESMLESSNFVKKIEKKYGKKLGCIEEIAYSNKWISKNDLTFLGNQLNKSEYGKYLINLTKKDV